ncbi:MAG: PAS domain-containing protein, partial [Beijerinckiaceae bacterium]
TAAGALAEDAIAARQPEEHRFGPAVSEILTARPVLPTPPTESIVEAAAIPDPTPEPSRPAPAPPPPPDPAAPPAPPAGEDERSPLSPSERNAFREIARALGKVAPEERRQEPPVIDSDGPLPASPRQMPAWIARRQKALHEQPQQPPVGAAPAPVVPIEAFQPKRARDPQQAAAILDRLPLAVLVMQDGKPVYGNQAFLELADQKDFAAFTAAGGADAFFSVRPPDAAQGATSAIAVRDRGGRLVHVDAQVQAGVWDGAPASLMTFRRQTAPTPAQMTSSQAKALELDLLAAKAELTEMRFALDTATDGVLSLDANGRILAVNRSAEALFGFDQNEIAGEPFTVLLEPDSHPAALDYLEGLKTGGVATIMNDGRDVVGRERHGGRIPLFMTLGRMGSGEGARFCAVLRDVTIW